MACIWASPRCTCQWALRTRTACFVASDAVTGADSLTVTQLPTPSTQQSKTPQSSGGVGRTRWPVFLVGPSPPGRGARVRRRGSAVMGFAGVRQLVVVVLELLLARGLQTAARSSGVGAAVSGWLSYSSSYSSSSSSSSSSRRFLLQPPPGVLGSDAAGRPVEEGRFGVRIGL